jgi:hypothetical protein
MRGGWRWGPGERGDGTATGSERRPAARGEEARVTTDLPSGHPGRSPTERAWWPPRELGSISSDGRSEQEEKGSTRTSKEEVDGGAPAVKKKKEDGEGVLDVICYAM